MSRHRNVRKLNIEEELEEDDADFYDYDEEEEAAALSPETSKFLYQRPGFPAPSVQTQSAAQAVQPVVQAVQQQQTRQEEKPWIAAGLGAGQGTRIAPPPGFEHMFPMDEDQQPQKKTPVQPMKPGNGQKMVPPTSATSSPTKQQQPKVAVAPAVESLRIGEGADAKVRTHSRSPARTVATPKQAQLSNLEMAMAAVPKYRQRTRPAEAKAALNLVIVGHVDAGKSTLIGHLLYLLGNVDERAMHRMRQESSRLGKSSFAFAWILDDTEEERVRGVTMDIARTSFESPGGRKFHILDAPGHKDFIPNMISGASQADAALLVVNATRGEFETGFDQGGQTREHALLVRALGVSRLVVAVNKLDTCDWSRDRFDELCAILSAFLLRRAGFESVQFVPVSGLLGVNLVKPPEEGHPLEAWQSEEQQQTLVQALESLPLLPSPAVEQPLRAVVNDVLRYAPTSLTLTIKVESGHVEMGDRLFLMPEANPVTVKAVSLDDSLGMMGSSSGSSSALSSLLLSTPSKSISSGDQQQCCFAGDQAAVTLAGAFEPDSVFPGHVLCRGGTELLLPCRQFRARLVTFDIRMPILRGTRAELFVHSLRVPCVVSRLLVMHPGAKDLEKRNPRFVPRNVSAIVEIRTELAINVEPFSRSKQLGRIALRAGGETIAAGIVLDRD